MATAQPQPRTKHRTKPKAKSKPVPPPAFSGTRSFFERVQKREHEPLLKRESGTLRFDLSRGPQLEHWHVTISDGNLTVSHLRSRADTIVKVDGELFDRIAQGTANAMTAQLRGVLVVEGDLHLLMVFQRLFPGPPRTSTSGRPVAEARADRPSR